MNKKNIIITIVIAILCLLIGGLSTYLVTTKLINVKKCEIKEENNTPKENEEKEEHEPDESEEKENELDEQEKENEIDYDELLLSLNININHEDLLNSSDSFLSGNYIGSMYSSKISNEYKAMYSLEKYLDSNFPEKNEKIVSYIFENGTATEEYETMFSIKVETLNKIIKTFFSSGEISDTFETNGAGYYSIAKISCKNKQCNIFLTGIGGSGYPPNYNNKIISKKYNRKTKGYEYIVSAYYVEMGDNSIDIYDKKKGTLLKKIAFNSENSDEFTNNTIEMYLYDSYAEQLGNKIKSFKYTFDDNNRLVSVAELN